MLDHLPAWIARSRSLLWLPAAAVLWSTGCSSQQTVESQGSRRPSDPLLNQFAGNFSYGRDADGSMRVQSDQRSVFERSDGSNLKSNFNAREFNANQWRGSNQAARVRDYQGASQQFSSHKAREQGAGHRMADMSSREQSTSAREQAQGYATGQSGMGGVPAREAGAGAREAGSRDPMTERAGDYRPASDSQQMNHRPLRIQPDTGPGRAYSPGQVRSLLGKD